MEYKHSHSSFRLSFLYSIFISIILNIQIIFIISFKLSPFNHHKHHLKHWNNIHQFPWANQEKGHLPPNLRKSNVPSSKRKGPENKKVTKSNKWGIKENSSNPRGGTIITVQLNHKRSNDKGKNQFIRDKGRGIKPLQMCRECQALSPSSSIVWGQSEKIWWGNIGHGYQPAGVTATMSGSVRYLDLGHIPSTAADVHAAVEG